MVDRDRIEGSGKKLGGDLKVAAGKALGDGKLEAEGRGEQLKGKIQNAVGGVKDALRDKDRRM